MFIYKIENMINNKVYIGQTIHKIKSRYRTHLRCAINKKPHPLYNSMNHYGIDSFKLSEVEHCNSMEELNLREIHWMEFFNSQDRKFGYNLNSGGFNGLPCEETKRKLSIANKGKKLTEEHKRKIGVANKKKMTPERRKEISESLMGHFVSKETIEKIAKTRKEKGVFKHTEETKRKISVAGIGRLQTKETIEKRVKTRMDRDGYKMSEETRMKLIGRKHTKESRLKMSISRNRYVKYKKILNFIASPENVPLSEEEIEMYEDSAREEVGELC